MKRRDFLLEWTEDVYGVFERAPSTQRDTATRWDAESCSWTVTAHIDMHLRIGLERSWSPGWAGAA